MMNKTDLRKKFDELPDKIREWLTSERATYVVIDINERLGMIGPLVKIIPNTILRLVTKDIEPSEFINVLSKELDIDFNSAKNIAQEIEEKILRPIEGLLRREADIDIKLIYFASPTAKPTQPTQTPIAIRVEPPVRQIPTPPASPTRLGGPPFPQSRPTFQPIRPPASPAQLGGPIIRLPINVPKNDQGL